MFAPFRVLTDADIGFRHHRPVIGWALGFILGVALGVNFGHGMIWLCVGTVAILLAWCFRRCAAPLFLATIAFAAGYGARTHEANADSSARLTAAQTSGEPITLIATVANNCVTIPRQRGAPFAFFSLEEATFDDGTALSGINMQGFYYDADGPLPATGERWRFHARIRSNAWFNTMQCSLYGAPNPEKSPRRLEAFSPVQTEPLTGETLLERLRQSAATGDTFPLIVRITQPPRIVHRARGGDYAIYTLNEATLADGTPIAHPKISLFYYDKTAHFPAVGERWSLPVTLRKNASPKAIAFTCKVETPPLPASQHLVADDRHDTIRYRFARLRNRLADHLALGVAPEDALLTQTMTLGVRKKLPREERQRYGDAGIIHIFSISGLHVGILAGILIWLLAWVGIHLRTRAFILIPILFLYLILTGIPPSAARACLMASLYCASPLFFRHPDATTSLLITAVLSLLYEPNWITNVGALLSFTVMGGILLYMSPFSYLLNLLFHSRLRTTAIGELPHNYPWHFRLRRTLASLLALTLAAWLASLPLTLYFFGRFSIVGLVLNLFIPPLTLFIVWAACASALLGFILPSLSILLNQANAHLLHLIERICDLTLHTPWAIYETHLHPSPPFIYTFVLLLFAGALYLRAAIKYLRAHDPRDPHAYAVLLPRPHTN